MRRVADDKTAGGEDAHFSEGGVNRSAANLDGDGGVEHADGGLEGLEAEVLVREEAILAVVDAEGDADGDVVLIGAEPGVALGLLEDVVQKGVVPVVIHG